MFESFRLQVSLQDFRKMTGHTAVGGACLSQGLLPGCEEPTVSEWRGTQKDFGIWVYAI